MKEKDPSLIRTALLKFFSIIPPRINPIAGIQSQAEAAERSKTLESMKLRVKDVAKAAKQTSRLTQQLLSMEHISQRSIKS